VTRPDHSDHSDPVAVMLAIADPFMEQAEELDLRTARRGRGRRLAVRLLIRPQLIPGPCRSHLT
jgi:hypothetical protein